MQWQTVNIVQDEVLSFRIPDIRKYSNIKTQGHRSLSQGHRRISQGHQRPGQGHRIEYLTRIINGDKNSSVYSTVKAHL